MPSQSLPLAFNKLSVIVIQLEVDKVSIIMLSLSIQSKVICLYSQRNYFPQFAQLGREVLDIAARAIRPGITTDEIDRLVHEACIERDCYPSPLNYYEFPKSCCT